MFYIRNIGELIEFIKGNKIICSIDKDLNQIAGLHYNPTLKEFYGITKKQADYNFIINVLLETLLIITKVLLHTEKLKRKKLLIEKRIYGKSLRIVTNNKV